MDYDNLTKAELINELNKIKAENTALINDNVLLKDSLRSAKKKYSLMLDDSPIGIFKSTIDGRFVEANYQMAKLFGYKDAQTFMKQIKNISDEIYSLPNTRINIIEIIKSNPELYTFEVEFKKLDGSTFFADIICKLIWSHDNKPKYLFGFVRDISERKIAELKNAEKNELRKALFEGSANPILICDNNAKVLELNHSFTKTFGWTASEIAGESIPFNEDLRDFPKWMKLCSKGGSIKVPQSARVKKNHSQIYISLSVTPFFNNTNTIVAFCLMYDDLSISIKAYEYINAIRKQQQTILDAAPAAICFKDNKNNYIRVNKAVSELVNLKIEDIEGKNAAQIFPDRADEYFKDDQEVIKSGIPKLGTIETFQVNGIERWMRTDRTIWYDDNGDIAGVIAYSIDITDRIKSEAALKRKIALEELVSNISSHFLKTLYSEFAHEVERDLSIIADFSEIEEAFLVIFNKNSNREDEVYSWNNIYPENSLKSEWLVFKDAQWAKDYFIAAKPIVFDALENMPSEADNEKQILESLNIKSLMTIPLRSSDDTLGYFGLCNFSCVKKWDDVDIQILRIVGDVFVHAYLRKIVLEELAESEARFRLVTNSINDVIWTVDLDFKFTFISSSVEKLLCYNIGDLIGHDFSEILCTDSYNTLNHKFIETIRGIYDGIISKNISFKLELEHIRKDSSKLWAELSLGPLINENGDVIGIHGITRDISDRKESENKLKNLITALRISNDITEQRAKEISLLNEQLGQSQEHLKELIADKDKFFSIIAHDLKGPLFGFLGLTDMLSRDLTKMSLVELNETVKLMNSTAKNLFKLLENLLEWARSQTGRIEFQPEEINLNYIAENKIELFQSVAEKKKIKLYHTVPADISVYADAKMLLTILRNLINNALKFTAEGGEVFVNAENSDGEVIISVNDTGIGMSDDLVSKLFRIDTKVKKLGTDNEDGTGLGLIICKEFVEKHRGRIWVESKEGLGSSFKFSMPSSNIFQD